MQSGARSRGVAAVALAFCIPMAGAASYTLQLKCEGVSPKRVYPILTSCFACLPANGILKSVQVQARRIFDDQYTFKVAFHTSAFTTEKASNQDLTYELAYVHGTSIREASMEAVRVVNTRVQSLSSADAECAIWEDEGLTYRSIRRAE